MITISRILENKGGPLAHLVERHICPDFNIFKMFWNYILKSEKTRSYYVGCCRDVLKRLQQHNSKKVRSTKFGVPWKLIYKESSDSFKKVRIREKEIKSWKSRKAIENLVSNFENIKIEDSR